MGLDGQTDGRTDTAQVRRLVGCLLHLGQTRHGGLDRGQASTDRRTDGRTDTAQVRRLVGRLLHLGQTRHGELDRG